MVLLIYTGVASMIHDFVLCLLSIAGTLIWESCELHKHRKIAPPCSVSVEILHMLSCVAELIIKNAVSTIFYQSIYNN